MRFVWTHCAALQILWYSHWYILYFVCMYIWLYTRKRGITYYKFFNITCILWYYIILLRVQKNNMLMYPMPTKLNRDLHLRGLIFLNFFLRFTL